MHDRKRPPKLRAGDFITPTVRLVRLLAEGGMGKVWIAEHLGLKSRVVVKLMAEEMTARPDGAERFAQEAAAAAAIKSPHVVQVFDHGVTSGGIPYIVMELLEGKDLGAHLAERGRLTPEEVLAIVVQVGKALSRAHKASIVHRDIKPDNIFLCDPTDAADTGATAPEIFVKLLDFGTARHEPSADSSAARTTAPGQIMGTPYYMSPEQSVGTDLDARSDIWSLGVVAFEALTGKKPFDGGSVGAITIAIHGPFPRITDLAPELPPALEGWFDQACAQAPSDRFPTVRAAIDGFVEAVTGTAPNDQPTESICFATPEKQSPSVQPVSFQPLMETLPVAGAERRTTTIAAGLVMAIAALAMAGIVLRRSPAPPAAPAGLVAHAPTMPVAPAHDPIPPPPPKEPEPEPELEPALAVAPSPRPAAPAAPPLSPAKAAAAHLAATPRTVAHGSKNAKAAAAPIPADATPPHATPTTGPAAAPKDAGPSHEDDDLVRLRNAAAKHAAPPVEPTPPPGPAPAPAPVAPAPPGEAPSLAPLPASP